MNTADNKAFHPVCAVDTLADNGAHEATINGRDILLCQSDGTLYAVENRCTHQQTPLAAGRIRRGYISCPLHGVRFNLATGEPAGQLTRVPLPTYTVEVRDGIAGILLDPEESAADAGR